MDGLNNTLLTIGQCENHKISRNSEESILKGQKEGPTKKFFLVLTRAGTRYKLALESIFL